ncbi:MAG: histidine phosphatase family protein [Planctomycetota bacterium]
MSSFPEVWIVRHGEVEARWKRICYGSLDVSLSEAGKLASERVASRLLHDVSPRVIYHSGLSRTRYLAEQIASLAQVNPVMREDVRLQERNYGQWQGLSWDEAYESDPEHFHDLIEKPKTYRPPEGETTSEMQQRMVQWLGDQEGVDGPVIACSHSGPIAAIAGFVKQLPATKWGPWTIKHLDAICLRQDSVKREEWDVERPWEGLSN